MKICTSDEVFPLKIGTVIRDVRYLAVRVWVGEEGLGWAICRSGKLVGARGFCWGISALWGWWRVAGFGCFWKFRRGSCGREEGRKKEQFLKLVARDL